MPLSCHFTEDRSYNDVHICEICNNFDLQHPESTEGDHENDDRDLSDTDDGSDQPFMVSIMHKYIRKIWGPK